MKTHDHDNAHSTQRRAVAQQAEHGEAATQLAQTGADTFDHRVNHSPRMVAQRQLLGAAFGPALQQPVQREAGLDDEEQAAQAKQEVPTEANLTGMPNQLKSGVEALSGMDMSDVRVHRNSDRPAQLNALAYAQGNDIHLGPGQEQHLPHEAWHVVQQRQGRVQATVQMAGVGVNGDAGLEREVDLMGGKAQAEVPQWVGGSEQAANRAGPPVETQAAQRVPTSGLRVVQRLTNMNYNPVHARPNTDSIIGMLHARVAHTGTQRQLAAFMSGYDVGNAPGNCNHYVPYVSVANAVREAISLPAVADLSVAVPWLNGLALPGGANVTINSNLYPQYTVGVGNVPPVNIPGVGPGGNQYNETDINQQVDDLIFNLANDPRNLFYWPNSSGDAGGTAIDNPNGAGGMNVNTLRTRLQAYRQALLNLGLNVV